MDETPVHAFVRHTVRRPQKVTAGRPFLPGERLSAAADSPPSRATPAAFGDAYADNSSKTASTISPVSAMIASISSLSSGSTIPSRRAIFMIET